MMRSTVNELLIDTIKNNLPKSQKPVSFVKDILNLSRESAYRRIRNEISFTFEEIATIALHLGFSLDELIGQTQQNRFFLDMPVKNSEDPVNIYCDILSSSLDIYKKMQSDKIHTYLVINQLPFAFYLPFENLAKFHYYRWIHQTQNTPLNFHFSEFNLPPEIIAIHKMYKYNITKIKYLFVILCPNIFQSLIKEISYFYRRMLISENEIELLQKELFCGIDDLEKSIHVGINENGTNIDLYLSSLTITSSSIMYRHDQKTICQLQTYLSPIITHDQEVCRNNKNMMKLMLKYATLISNSNEIQRADFFHKQREYIKDIRNNTL